jgi:predicted metal-dependent enzyme (double-stranded beta helix superfamily)
MVDRFIHSSSASRRSRSSLADLVASLDFACEKGEPSGDLVVAAIERACLQPQLLTDAQHRGAPDRYTRHVLHTDPAGRYALVALVWEPGQRSPVHAHHTWCGYGIVEGRLCEESYAYRHDVAKARRVDASDRSPGVTCFTQAGLDGIHRLGNSGAQRAVSIHVYGVESARVGSDVNQIVSVVGD